MPICAAQDSVGGELLDAVFLRMNKFGRLINCGQISQYDGAGYAIHNTAKINHLSLTFSGFLYFDYVARFGEARAQLSAWVKAGLIKEQITAVEGFDNIPQGFAGMFDGANTGKMFVKVRHRYDMVSTPHAM